jgi:fructose-1-phosphate kinase PfkB-like protein
LDQEQVPSIIIEVETLRENDCAEEKVQTISFALDFGANYQSMNGKCLDAIDKITTLYSASGSLPVEYQMILQGLQLFQRKNLKLIVDTSKAALKHAANEGIYMLNNLNELSLLFDKKHINEVNAAERNYLEKYASFACFIGRTGAKFIYKRQ